MAPSHPALQSYAHTIHGSFPLILAIGREPNTDLPISVDHGLYDFDAAPRCAFWNVSFGLLGRSAGLTIRELKAEARNRKAAPIIYADALPIGLKNEIVDKRRMRVVDTELTNQHINRIFNYRQLLDRVEVVLISGLDDQLFRTSVAKIRELCVQTGKTHVELPFFYPTNTPRIRSAVSDDLNESMRRIVERFLASTGS